MAGATVHIQGVYRVPLTDKLFAEAMELKYGGENLSSQERIETEAGVREELSSVVLIDVVVNDGGEGFDVGGFSQKHMDQVAYDEAFLSSDGVRIESRDNRPPGDECRLAFFLHYYDPNQPLETPFGSIQAPEPTEMPTYLKKLIPYDPVD